MKSISKNAKKYLGQNFLIDDAVKNHIIDSCDLHPQETVLEIGPGRGALTYELLKHVSEVYAIEKDAPLAKLLTESITTPSLHVIEADFLTLDLAKLPTIHKVIGNIPYNISTPIIEKLIRHRTFCPDIFLTVQLEFAKRLIAKPDTKDYGALTCFVRYYADTQILFKISPNAFRPVPKVTSCLIHVHFQEPAQKADNETFLFHVTQTAFHQRRKKILNALSPMMKKDRLEQILDELKIEKGKRAENIPLSDYIRLANTLQHL